jgi:small conductance mechanosensitive channel
VRARLTSILTEDPRVLTTPAPLVTVSEFGKTSVQLLMQAWVKTPEYPAVRSELLAQVKMACDQDGIAL